jgi:hypothetical protein
VIQPIEAGGLTGLLIGVVQHTKRSGARLARSRRFWQERIRQVGLSIFFNTLCIRANGSDAFGRWGMVSDLVVAVGASSSTWRTRPNLKNCGIVFND